MLSALSTACAKSNVHVVGAFFFLSIGILVFSLSVDLVTFDSGCNFFTAEGDITEKPVDPIKVYSEKELIREIEKIASTLVPEKDWSVRITAMQRVEALVFGGWFSLLSLSLLVHLCLCLSLHVFEDYGFKVNTLKLRYEFIYFCRFGKRESCLC